LFGHFIVVDVPEAIAQEDTRVVDENVERLPGELLAQRFDRCAAAYVDTVDDPDTESRQLIRGFTADSNHVIAARSKLHAELQPDSSVCACYQYGCHGCLPSCV
jgi:hypothetical protein